MNDNSYNVCSRCGSANPLTARYCYQCGFELKSADSPVLCSKCSTMNAASANFCKRCGSKLAKGDAKVMCPHCGFSNNAESDFCTNCGLDFNTRKLPLTDSNPNRPHGQFQQKPAAAQDKDQRNLSQLEAERKRREQELAYQQQQMMRREEERRLKDKEEKERLEKADAKKPTKEEKKQLKEQARQERLEVYEKEHEAEREVAAAVIKEKPRGRVRNIIAFVIALFGIYFMLLPSQIDFLNLNFFMANYVAEEGLTVGLTGWDVIIAAITPFMASASGMSPAVASLVEAGCALNFTELLIAGIVLVLFTIILLVYVVAKFVGIITGNGHRGLDILGLCSTIVALLAFVYLFFIGAKQPLSWQWALITPFGVFLAIMLINSVFGKSKKKKVKEAKEPKHIEPQQQQLSPSQMQQMQMQKIQAQVQQQRMQQQNQNPNQNGR